MRILLIASFSIALLVSSVSAGSECLENAKVVEPTLSKEAEKTYTENLEKARAAHKASPDDPDTVIWLGRRTAYLGKYKEAISIYTDGIAKFPKDARFYRHRGHRFISIRCFDDAVRDLEKAGQLVKGTKDEVEPDGLPNAKNIPTSTLQSNVWYHLGLAYYLKGDFENSLKAYKKCLKVSKNPDMLVATQNWHYLTLRKLGRLEDSIRVLKSIKDDLDIIENDSYYKLLKLYQGKINVIDLFTEIGGGDDLGNATVGYGIGNWLMINGEKEKAETIFRKILETDQWSSFGYIAAEAELGRLLMKRSTRYFR